MKYYHVEFYNLITGFLEHNDIYQSMDDAWLDAHGRVVIVTAVTVD